MKFGFQTLRFFPWHHSISWSIELNSPKLCSLKHLSYEMLVVVIKEGGVFHGQACLWYVDRYFYSQLSTLLFLLREACTLPISVWCTVFSGGDISCPIAFGLACDILWPMECKHPSRKLQDALEVSARLPALISATKIACSRPCLFFPHKSWDE